MRQRQERRTSRSGGERPFGTRGRRGGRTQERTSERTLDRTPDRTGGNRSGDFHEESNSERPRSRRNRTDEFHGVRNRRAGVAKRVEGSLRDKSSSARLKQTPDTHRSRDDDFEPQVNLDFVVGRRPVLEALKAGRPINKLLIAEGTEGGSLNEIVGKARGAGIVTQTVPRSHLNKIAGEGHQGVLAYVAVQAYVELDEILERDTGQTPLVVLLDEVTDPYNFGAVLRTAEATGVQGVVIPKRRAVPLTGVVAKAAAGAVEYVPVARVSNLVQAIDTLKANGYWVVGAEGASDTAFTDVDYKGKTALVIGAEGKGLSRLVSEKCDFLVKLPMLGKLSSLNASVAAGVMLYEIVRQRG